MTEPGAPKKPDDTHDVRMMRIVRTMRRSAWILVVCILVPTGAFPVTFLLFSPLNWRYKLALIALVMTCLLLLCAAVVQKGLRAGGHPGLMPERPPRPARCSYVIGGQRVSPAVEWRLCRLVDALAVACIGAVLSWGGLAGLGWRWLAWPMILFAGAAIVCQIWLMRTIWSQDGPVLPFRYQGKVLGIFRIKLELVTT